MSDSLNGTDSEQAAVVEEKAASGSAGDTGDNVILEGTLGPDPARPPLDRSLVSGSTAPKGSDGFVREADQVLYGTDESAGAAADAADLSPEKPATE